MRVLKMHSVMPRMLRKVTEPPVCHTKNYIIDVDQKIRQAKEEFKSWKKMQPRPNIVGLTTEESTSSDAGSDHNESLGRAFSMKKQETAKRMVKKDSLI